MIDSAAMSVACALMMDRVDGDRRQLLMLSLVYEESFEKGDSSMSTVHQRLDLHQADPAAYRALAGLERYVRDSGLNARLHELVKIRASQVNGCAYCLDLHLRNARTEGEDQRRLDVLSAWREAPGLFTEEERAALGLTESVTRISEGGVPDDVWQDALAQFGETGIAHLLMAISMINVWNRLAISTHQQLPDLPAPDRTLA